MTLAPASFAKADIGPSDFNSEKKSYFSLSKMFLAKYTGSKTISLNVLFPNPDKPEPKRVN